MVGSSMKAFKATMLSVALGSVAVLLPVSAAQAQGDMYYELQMLRDEVRQLSGRLEELNFEVQRLKQRQLEDYMELDRRISPDAGDEAGDATAPSAASRGPALAGPTIPQPEDREGLPPVASEPQVHVDTSAEDAQGPQLVASAADQEQYDAAYNLLRQRRIDDAANAFRNYINSHPRGRFVPNAHYWLGEIYLLQNRLDDARLSFQTVKDNFPRDQKAEDAAYKLARVYHLQGEDQRARTLLQEVGAGSSNTAQLARDYLRDNF